VPSPPTFPLLLVAFPGSAVPRVPRSCAVAALSRPESPAIGEFQPSIRSCTALHCHHFIDAALFTLAVEKPGGWGVIDLIGVGGYYRLLSIVLNVTEIPLSPGGNSPQRQEREEKQGPGIIP